ncbi:MAG TPA: type II toxin-antitoxin system VapB family antitoxin [Bryobacteraceae bacterium]|nr:type II toxin-antitoxin system VapB family antitoxin [Bryobacteraceae bacterium]
MKIESPEADRLARELAAKTGETVDEAVITALRERLAQKDRDDRVGRVIKNAQEAIAKLPVLDDRSADEILGYDEWGLPH